MNRNHLTWSVETHDGKCGECGTKTVLVVAPLYWREYDGEESFEVPDELSGHFCPKCQRLRSLSLNTQEAPASAT